MSRTGTDSPTVAEGSAILDVKPRAGRAVLVLGLATAAGWLLLRLGDGPLSAPFGSTDRLGTWLDETDPAVMAGAVLRLVGIGLCGHLAVVTAFGLLSALVGWGGAATVAGRLLPRTFRCVLVGGTGLGLTGSLVSPSLVAASTDGPDAHDDVAPDRMAVMIKLEPGDGGAGQGRAKAQDPASAETSADRAPEGTEESTAVPPTTGSTTTSTTAPPPGASPDTPSGGTAAATAASEAPGTDTWTVRTGDSFWSIAEEVVAERFEAGDGPAPSDADVALYWRELIDANWERLARPDDPDLLFPGQKLLLP